MNQDVYEWDILDNVAIDLEHRSELDESDMAEETKRTIEVLDEKFPDGWKFELLYTPIDDEGESGPVSVGWGFCDLIGIRGDRYRCQFTPA